MGLNRKCPKCGSEKVQLSDTTKKHGCLWFILLGWIYILWMFFKWMIGFMVLICLDWWMAIIKKSQNKGYVWKSKRWFSGKTQYYYCHDCGHNFKA
ncbi:MAG: hypothetical protein E7653_06230 [Ruminococcaceae bacterium]|nr:hypothetical protein [Oscillospiraceae bacterium]